MTSMPFVDPIVKIANIVMVADFCFLPFLSAVILEDLRKAKK